MQKLPQGHDIHLWQKHDRVSAEFGQASEGS